MSLKVLLVSNAPWTATAYGQQTATLARRLRDDGHHVVIYCNYGLQGGVQTWEGMQCLPSNGEGYVDPIIKGHIRYADPDLVLTFHDLWPLTNTDIPPFIQSSRARWAAWFPIDAVPVSTANLQALVYVDYPIVMANFAEEALRPYGVKTTVIPHGVEKHFGFTAAGRREFRRHLEVPEDAFLFGSVGRNAYYPGRKGFDRLMRAFAEAALPDSYLYIHALTNSENGSVPLPQVAKFYGIEDRVRFADDYNGVMGYSKAGMNALYSALDCYVQPTLGEGFGVPVIEAQACGAVVIATDCTSMPELVCPEASQLVPGATELFVPDPSHRVLIDIEKLKEAMREVYEIKRDNPAGFRAMKARAGLWSNGWDWDRLWQECWRPFLASVESEMRMSPRTERHRGDGLVYEHKGRMRKQDSSLRSPAVSKELALLRQLDHPNIISVLEDGVAEDGTAWFDMPMYRSLLDIDVSTLDERKRERIITGVMDALSYLHARDLSHRDVCPANVVVDDKYNPYLIDFEWAHPCDGSPCVDFEPWKALDKAVAIMQLGMEQRGFHTIVEYIRGIDLSEKSHGFKGVPYQLVDGAGERDCQPRWKLMQPDIQGKTVLDIGCNLGWFVRESLGQGAQLAVGIDNDRAVIEAARTLGAGEYLVADLDGEIGLQQNFDVIFCLSVLQHVKNPDGLMDWMLEHGRELYIEVPTRFITEHMASVLKDAQFLGESDRGRPIYRVLVREGAVV